MMGEHGFWGFMGLGWIFWVIILAVIIWAVVKIVNTSKNNQQRTSSQETPLEILKKRYASGEISKEQFEQMKKDLE